MHFFITPRSTLILCTIVLTFGFIALIAVSHRKHATALIESVDIITTDLSNVHSAIQKYIKKYHVVPPDVSELVSLGLLNHPPRNPYHNRLAVNVGLKSEHRSGDYSYLIGWTRKSHNGSLISQERTTYLLIGYGNSDSATLEANIQCNTAMLEKLLYISFDDVVFRSGNAGMVTHSDPSNPIVELREYATESELLKLYGYIN